VARAQEVVGFDCEEAFGAAAARVIAVRTTEVFDHAAGVLDIEDIERVHDMRVATRRLRAALESFEPCFPAKPWRRAVRKVKALGDALGQRRDRDVQIGLLTSLSGNVAAADGEGLAGLIEQLRVEQQRANGELAAHVTPERLLKLRGRLEDLIERVEG
jgi:CHAD domain-containing protein